MSAVFLKILNMSITASWLILAVLLTRLLLKKAPKWIACLLWGLVAIRLICPFSLESAFSLIPSSETIPANIAIQQQPAINSGIPILNQAVNPVIAESFTPAPVSSANPLQVWIPVAALVWIAGIGSMLLYALISYLRLRRRVAVTVQISDGVLACDEVPSPFILGVFRPKIYVPSSLHEPQLSDVLAHENAHLQRKDHWWKPLGFLLLSVYWFNPLCWLAYILLCRDIEMACDEKVIREMDKDRMAAYSQTILDCGLPRRRIAACPLAFGEVGIKARVKSVLNYKKPAFWIILTAILVCAVLAVCLLTDPFSNRSLSDKLGVSMDMAIAEHHQSADTEGRFSVVDYDVLRVSKSVNRTTVYAWVMYEEYSFDGTDVKEESGSHIPTVITFDTSSSGSDTSSYPVIEYWEPRDGSYFAEDIRAKFPLGIRAKAFDVSNAERQHENCLRAAREYFGVGQDTEETALGKYYLTVGADGVKSILITAPYFSGGCENADGSLYQKGEQVWLEALDGREDLRGVTITALDENGKILWTASVPDTEDNKGFTRLTQDGWTVTNLGGTPTESTGSPTDLETLRAKYPEYFDLDTFKGLELYVWQMAPDSYSCGLMFGTNRNKTPEELMNLKGASIAEMRAILSTYDIPQEDVFIIPCQNPISSYMCDYWVRMEGEDDAVYAARQQAYIIHIREMLFGEEAGNAEEFAPSASDIVYPGKDVTMLIGPEVSSIGVTRIEGGHADSCTVTGEKVALLRDWANNLQYELLDYEEGHSPGDVNGGSSYSFALSGGEDPGFTFRQNGGKGYLLIEGTWYTVAGFTHPPCDEFAWQPSFTIVANNIRPDVCALYLEVLEDLWNVDPGLNDGISQIGIDLSGLSHLTEAEKETVMQEFASKHNLPFIAGTWEELCEQGYIDKENLCWEDGLFFSIKTNEDAEWNLPYMKDGDSVPELTAFDAQKWRSGTGAYFFGQCSTQKNADGKWSYTVGQHAIA